MATLTGVTICRSLLTAIDMYFMHVASHVASLVVSHTGSLLHAAGLPIAWAIIRFEITEVYQTVLQTVKDAVEDFTAKKRGRKAAWCSSCVLTDISNAEIGAIRYVVLFTCCCGHCACRMQGCVHSAHPCD